MNLVIFDNCNTETVFQIAAIADAGQWIGQRCSLDFIQLSACIDNLSLLLKISTAPIMAPCSSHIGDVRTPLVCGIHRHDAEKLQLRGFPSLMHADNGQSFRQS